MSIIDTFIAGLLATGRLAYPKTVMIDPVNMCQLECPLCSTGRKTLNYDRKIMTLEIFKTVLGKIPFVRKINLFKNGEPFLNPDIFAMVRYAADRNIKVVISTNFSFSKPETFFENIVKSGLGELIVSLDGASQESYSQYRRGGDFDMVMSNIKKLIETKKRLNSSTPKITWQFLVNRFNEHEIAIAEKISNDLEITLDLQPMGLGDDLPEVEHESTIQERKSQWLPANKKYVAGCYKGDYQYPLFPGMCVQLFGQLIVAVDGKVLPCCWAENRDNVFGDLLTESFEDIWHNQMYVDSRLHFLKNDFRPQVETVCFRCHNFSDSPSLRNKINLLLWLWRNNRK